jgi:hypothetical protein
MIRALLTEIIRGMGDGHSVTQKPVSLGFKIVELMGHRRLAGEVFEARLSGEQVFKVVCAEPSATEVHFTMRSVFAMTACAKDEATALMGGLVPGPLNDARRCLKEEEKRASKHYCAECGNLSLGDSGCCENGYCPNRMPPSSARRAASLLEDDVEKSSPGFVPDAAKGFAERGFVRKARRSVSEEPRDSFESAKLTTGEFNEP